MCVGGGESRIKTIKPREETRQGGREKVGSRVKHQDGIYKCILDHWTGLGRVHSVIYISTLKEAKAPRPQKQAHSNPNRSILRQALHALHLQSNGSTTPSFPSSHPGLTHIKKLLASAGQQNSATLHTGTSLSSVPCPLSKNPKNNSKTYFLLVPNKNAQKNIPINLHQTNKCNKLHFASNL